MQKNSLFNFYIVQHKLDFFHAYRMQVESRCFRAQNLDTENSLYGKVYQKTVKISFVLGAKYFSSPRIQAPNIFPYTWHLGTKHFSRFLESRQRILFRTQNIDTKHFFPMPSKYQQLKNVSCFNYKDTVPVGLVVFID